MMQVQAAIAHRLPGRVRLRMAQCRGDRAAFSRIEKAFRDIGTIHAVKLNVATGSAVLEFDGSLDGLNVELRKHGVIVQDFQEQPVRAAPHFSTSKPLQLVTGRNINSMFMLGSLLVAASAMQAFRGRILAPSIPLLWSAVQAFRYSEGRRA